MIEAGWQPGGPRPPLHYHPGQDEHFEVLAGTLAVALESEKLKLGRGASFDVPAGTVHEMWNAGEDEARVRWEVRPPLRTEELLESFFGLVAGGHVNARGMPNPLRAAVVLKAHAAELRLAKPPWPVQRVALGLMAGIGRLLGYPSRYSTSAGQGG